MPRLATTARNVSGVSLRTTQELPTVKHRQAFGGAGTNDPAGAIRASSSGARTALGVRTPASPTLTLLRRAMV
jgi:hypothetical protein